MFKLRIACALPVRVTSQNQNLVGPGTTRIPVGKALRGGALACLIGRLETSERESER